MQAFQALFDRLDQLTGTNAKVTALAEHFRSVPADDAAWALTLLLGKRRRRLITGRRLREVLHSEGAMVAGPQAPVQGAMQQPSPLVLVFP